MHASCTFCGHPHEAILHLIDECAGTHNYWVVNYININTITQESKSNLLKIAKFDVWFFQLKCCLCNIATKAKNMQSSFQIIYIS